MNKLRNFVRRNRVAISTAVAGTAYLASAAVAGATGTATYDISGLTDGITNDLSVDIPILLGLVAGIFVVKWVVSKLSHFVR